MVLVDMIWCSLRYGSSFADYFNFGFYRKNSAERRTYVTTGYLYRFHRALNNRDKAREIARKDLFRNRFGKFCVPCHVFGREEVEGFLSCLEDLVGDKIVVKDPRGAEGKTIRILDVERRGSVVYVGGVNGECFFREFLEENKEIYFEKFITQHPLLEEISPSAVNTIRVITVVADESVNVIGAAFRISVGCPVDNYAAGNLAAEVDCANGRVVTGGIKRQACCAQYHDHHPLTGARIKGFQIPYWREAMAMIREAALIEPEVRTVGWDIAITEEGPLIVEANPSWNKGAWQIPAGNGKKFLIAGYLP